MKYFLVVLYGFYFTATLQAQILRPTKKDFNLGLFDGLGGANITPVPAADITYKGVTLRLAPSVNTFTAGGHVELLKISDIFYNWYWIASGYYGIGKEEAYFGIGKDASVKRAFLLTGVKVYFGKRFYSQFEIGGIREAFEHREAVSKQKLAPYYEFGLGISLFPTYLPVQSPE